MTKPSVVVGITDNVATELYLGTDAEAAHATAKDARGQYAEVWKTLHGRAWERWKGKVESAPALKVSTPRKAYTRATK